MNPTPTHDGHLMRNGVGARSTASFDPRFRSSVPARIEGVLAAAVIAAVLAIFYYLLVKLPGPLVVHVEDDTHQGIMNAHVACVGPDGKRFSALTDVFGEAKWPGLAHGAWRCEALPPPKFHTAAMVGYASVVPRKPAVWLARVERPTVATVQVVRPKGEPRAAPAVRAVCAEVPGESAPPTWEARAGLLDGRATMYLPHGRACRIGLVRPELPANAAGPVTDAKLSCASAPCTPELRGGVGEELQVVLAPNPDQWQEVRPPVEAD